MRTGTKAPARATGVTLIELSAALVLLGLLSAWTIPALGHWLERSRVDARAHALLAVLRYARAEAVRRAGPVMVCRAGSGARCASPGQACAGGARDWSCGWLVLAGVPGARPSAGTLRVAVSEPRVSIGGRVTALVFTPPAGQVMAGNRSFEFAPRGAADDAPGSMRRCLRIAQSGRARLVHGACTELP